MSLTLREPPKYSNDEKLSIKPEDGRSWLAAFTLKAQAAGMTPLLQGENPMTNSTLLSVAAHRLKVSEDHYRIEHPPPSGDARDAWEAEFNIFRTTSLSGHKLELLHEWQAAAIIWMKEALSDDVRKLCDTRISSPTPNLIFEFIKQHCTTSKDVKSPYYFYQRMVNCRYKPEDGSLLPCLAELENCVKAYNDTM